MGTTRCTKSAHAVSMGRSGARPVTGIPRERSEVFPVDGIATKEGRSHGEHHERAAIVTPGDADGGFGTGEAKLHLDRIAVLPVEAAEFDHPCHEGDRAVAAHREFHHGRAETCIDGTRPREGHESDCRKAQLLDDSPHDPGVQGGRIGDDCCLASSEGSVTRRHRRGQREGKPWRRSFERRCIDETSFTMYCRES